MYGYYTRIFWKILHVDNHRRPFGWVEMIPCLVFGVNYLTPCEKLNLTEGGLGVGGCLFLDNQEYKPQQRRSLLVGHYARRQMPEHTTFSELMPKATGRERSDPDTILSSCHNRLLYLERRNNFTSFVDDFF